MTEPKKTVYLQLPLSLYERIASLARESSRTLPSYIRQIIKFYLNQLEETQHK